MTPCGRPGCSGRVDETGFCQSCLRRPPQPAEWRRETGRPDGGSWTVDGVSLPVLVFSDPTGRVISDPQVPERSRTCSTCGTGVGRRYGGQAPLDEGFCPQDGTPFSFAPPKLSAGELVDDRYEVIGCLARGGQGWVYLAHDQHLRSLVALKRLINVADEVALKLQVAERRFLTELDHPNIVRITNFVEHRERGAEKLHGYLVMDYLNGQSLHELRRDVHEGRAEPSPLEHMIAYGHEILVALEYLHDRGLLYCDMKPDNVIRCEDRVRLIDLGGVRRINDRESPIVGAPGFLVPEEEIRENGLSVQSDLYAVGQTLRELFSATTESTSGAQANPAGPGVESFHQLVRRATDRNWNRRFGSAAEMAEQLKGVAREVVALRDRVEQPGRSIRFAPTAALLDGGLGTVPPLEWWTGGTGEQVLGTGRPPAGSAAAGLPKPRVAPDDPAAQDLEALERADPGQPGDHLRALAAADAAGADWRVVWYEGLRALACGDITTARDRFDSVYQAVPGETAPKLALGFCAELGECGDRLDPQEQAARYYEAVWWREHSEASAAFGLARVRLPLDDGRAAALAVLDRVPPISRHHGAARVAALKVQFGRLNAGPSGLPSEADVRAAEERLSQTGPEAVVADDAARDRLVAALREVALEVLLATGAHRLSGTGEVLGEAPDEERLRRLLEGSFRKLAQQARTADDHGALVDRANAVRPRTLR